MASWLLPGSCRQELRAAHPFFAVRLVGTKLTVTRVPTCAPGCVRSVSVPPLRAGQWFVAGRGVSSKEAPKGPGLPSARCRRQGPQARGAGPGPTGRHEASPRVINGPAGLVQLHLLRRPTPRHNRCQSCEDRDPRQAPAVRAYRALAISQARRRDDALASAGSPDPNACPVIRAGLSDVRLSAIEGACGVSQVDRRESEWLR
jgi:hypothetical protein